MSRHLPGVSLDLWVSQAFSTLRCMQPGDEFYAQRIINVLLNEVFTKKWASDRDIRVPDEMWDTQGKGMGILKAFLERLVRGQHLVVEGEDEIDNRQWVVTPLWMSPKLLKQCTTQRLESKWSGDSAPSSASAGLKVGLPLEADWTTFPINCLLKPSAGTGVHSEDINSVDGEILIPSSTPGTEKDVVRASLLLTRIAQISFETLGQRISDTIGMKRDQVVFSCMKVFMLEHGLDEGGTQGGGRTEYGDEVFRDGFVEAMIGEILGQYTFSQRYKLPQKTGHSSVLQDPYTLEQAALSFLGTSTTFYQFYTDLVALYDSISFSHPLFTKVLLPPLSMRYSVDYRKYLWDDFGHLVRNIRLPIEDVISDDVREFLYPIERNAQMLHVYLRVLFKYGDVMEEGFMMYVAIHHITANIWTDMQVSASASGPPAGHDERSAQQMLEVLAERGSLKLVRMMVTYRQNRDGDLLLPSRCFADSKDDSRRAKRLEEARRLLPAKMMEKLEGLFLQEWA
jgi:RNA polymerase II-associated protein 1